MKYWNLYAKNLLPQRSAVSVSTALSRLTGIVHARLRPYVGVGKQKWCAVLEGDVFYGFIFP